MTELRSLIERLVDAGIDPVEAAEIMSDAAMMFAAKAHAEMVHKSPKDEQAERRREKDRERKRQERLRKSAECHVNSPQTSVESTETKKQKEIPPTPPKEKIKNNINNIPTAPTREEDPPVSKPKSKKRATELPENWQPGDKEITFAKQQGLSDDQINIEAQRFTNHFWSASGQARLKRDWSATWRNWILSPYRQNTNRFAGNSKQQSASAHIRAAMAAEILSGDGQSVHPPDDPGQRGAYRGDEAGIDDVPRLIDGSTGPAERPGSADMGDGHASGLPDVTDGRDEGESRGTGLQGRTDRFTALGDQQGDQGLAAGQERRGQRELCLRTEPTAASPPGPDADLRSGEPENQDWPTVEGGS